MRAKIVVCLAVAVLAAALAVAPTGRAGAADVTGAFVDPSYGAAGSADLTTLSPVERIQGDVAFAVDTAGRATTAGTIGARFDADVVVARLDPSGQPDPGFADLVVDLGGSEQALAVELDAAGRVVILGSRITGDINTTGIVEPFVLRLLSDGSLDPAFGSGGVAFLPQVDNLGSKQGQLALSPDGVVVAWETDGISRLYRLAGDGAPDPAFGTNGSTDLDLVPGFVDLVYGVAVDSLGRAYVLNADLPSTGGRAIVTRITPAGSVDTSYGDDGFWRSATGDPPSQWLDIPTSWMHIDQKDRLVIAGRAVLPFPNSAWSVVRISEDGVNDPSFGVGGWVFGPDDPDGAFAGSITVGDAGPNGQLYVGHRKNTFNGIEVIRLTVDGAIDQGFGDNGSAFFDGEVFANLPLELRVDGLGRPLLLFVEGGASPSQTFPTIVRGVSGPVVGVEATGPALVLPGQQFSVQLEITNLGSESVDLTGHDVAVDDPSFVVVAQPAIPQALAVGASVVVDVVLDAPVLSETANVRLGIGLRSSSGIVASDVLSFDVFVPSVDLTIAVAGPTSVESASSFTATVSVTNPSLAAVDLSGVVIEAESPHLTVDSIDPLPATLDALATADVQVALTAAAVVTATTEDLLVRLRDASGPVAEATLAVTVEAPPPPDFIYVALGDSFASGEGTDRFTGIENSLYETGLNFDSILNDNTLTAGFPVDGQAGNACHRSLINYAKLNIDLFEPQQTSLLVDRTCSGSLGDPASGPQPPISGLGTGTWEGDREAALASSQINQALWVLDQQALDPTQVDLITVSMGGNDMGFADLIAACIASGVARQAIDRASILTPAALDPLTEFAEDYIQARWANCEALDPVIANTSIRLQNLELLLPTIYAELSQTFPNARILQVNYPAFLPEANLFPGSTCSGIDARDSAYALGVAEQLNQIIAGQIALANATLPNSFEVVDIADGFGPNPLCPVDEADRYFVNVPDGVLIRMLDRIFDPSRLPGQALAGATDPLTLTACAGAWLPGVDCFADDYLDLFLEWFTTEEGIEIMTSQLATIDPGIPAELEDAARFENSRTLFHPNARGFEVIACNVLATYRLESAGPCEPPIASPIAKRLFKGDDIDGAPKVVESGEGVGFELNGFAPGLPVAVLMQSEVFDLGTFVADQSGEIVGTLVMPDATPGVHRVTFIGVTAGGSDRYVTVLVDYGGSPEPGETYGVYRDGFGPYEAVTVEYLGGVMGSFVADQTGAVFFEIPVPDYAAVGNVPLTVSSPTVPPQTTDITAAAPDACAGNVPTIEGTANADVIVGTPGPDVIDAGAGNDLVLGLGGDDVVCAGPGHDVVFAGGGADTVLGDGGNDTLFGGSGSDLLDGGAADDWLFGNGGADELQGGDGFDRGFGGRGNDSCTDVEVANRC